MQGIDNQAQLSIYLCLIIKGFDNQDQEPNNQINQYLKKSLIGTLARTPTVLPVETTLGIINVNLCSELQTLKCKQSACEACRFLNFSF